MTSSASAPGASRIPKVITRDDPRVIESATLSLLFTFKNFNTAQNLGRVYGYDLFISATGVSPTGDQYRDEVEVDTEGGMVVDHMVTSDPDIYPAGDICSASWELSENWMQMGHSSVQHSSRIQLWQDEQGQEGMHQKFCKRHKHRLGHVKVVLENMSLQRKQDAVL